MEIRSQHDLEGLLKKAGYNHISAQGLPDNSCAFQGPPRSHRGITVPSNVYAVAPDGLIGWQHLNGSQTLYGTETASLDSAVRNLVGRRNFLDSFRNRPDFISGYIGRKQRRVVESLRDQQALKEQPS